MLGKLRSAPGWPREHPTATDAVLAAVLATASVLPLFVLTGQASAGARSPDALNIAVLLAGALAFTWRRRAPVCTLGTVLLAFAVLRIGSYNSTLLALALLVAAYTVGRRTGLHRGLAAIAASLPFLAGLVALNPHAGIAAYPEVLAAFCAAWWIGRNRRLRRAYIVELEQRAQQLERASAAAARAVRAEERARIARDLHDVLAHHVSVMTVQATAALRVFSRNPDGAREALTTIEGTGRTALEEMRKLVGVLRVPAGEPAGKSTAGPDAETGARAPQPDLTDIPALTDRLRQTGLIVKLDLAEPARPLPPGIGLAAYRIIQEALTNTLKHAGPPAVAEVTVRCEDGNLIVQVRDDGHGLAAGRPAESDPDRPRHGLVGMRERAALYGGQLRAGPRPPAGFEVSVVFPLDGTSLT